MSSHPDADAFVRAILREPTDVTTRLVFADWLEETGRSENVAWARYIRLCVTTRLPDQRWEEVRERRRELAELTAGLTVTLPLDAAQLVGLSDRFCYYWQFLPRANIVVRLAGYDLKRELIEEIPESVARESVVLPLDADGPRLWLAIADAHDIRTLQWLSVLLNRDIIPVRADAEQLRAAIDYVFAYHGGDDIDWDATYFSSEPVSPSSPE